MIDLDIKNALNSAFWRQIIEVMTKSEISTVRTVADYLSGGWLHINDNKKIEIKKEVLGLGPLLWNLYFEQILQIDLPEEVTK